MGEVRSQKDINQASICQVMQVAVTFWQFRWAWIFFLFNIFTQLAATHVNSLLGYPHVPHVTTSLNLGMPQPSKGKPHRRWPWPLTCNLCHPPHLNQAPSLCTGWLRMAYSLPGVSYYALTHTDRPHLWRLWQVCAHCGRWHPGSIRNYAVCNLDILFF